MEIDQIDIRKISLPFSREFSHSRRKEPTARNVVVEVIADRGKTKGYGEGAPRPYVTGESQESVTKNIKKFVREESFPWLLNDVYQIWDFVDSVSNGKQCNSAICAIEMSLLDALGRSQGLPITDYFPQGFYTDTVHYGASIPLSDRKQITEICQLIDKMGIRKLRLKMGQDFGQNSEAIQTVKLIFGDEQDLRIDVNGAWDCDHALKHIPLIRSYEVKVVEQPMMPGDSRIDTFAAAIANIDTVLMADESACTFGEIEKVLEEDHYKMVNVRMSKCGGFRNSLRIIDHLRQEGVPFQIGCQLGESGLLSAAGRALCLLCRDAAYYDGSYDAFLLRENITDEHVSFGLRGEAGPLDGPGLGVMVSDRSLKRLSTDCIRITR